MQFAAFNCMVNHNVKEEESFHYFSQEVIWYMKKSHKFGVKLPKKTVKKTVVKKTLKLDRKKW